MRFAKRNDLADWQIPNELWFLTTFDFANLDRRGARTRFRSTGRINRKYSKFVVSSFDEMKYGILGIRDVVIVTFDPNSTTDLAFLNDVTGDTATAIGNGCFPLKIDVVLTNFSHMRGTRWRRNIEFALYFKRCRMWTRFTEAGCVLCSYSKFVFVTTGQTIAYISRIFNEIIVGYSPRHIVCWITEFDLVTLNNDTKLSRII